MKQLILILNIFLFSGLAAQNCDLDKILDLRGFWKFKIGDQEEWANYELDDSHWKEIFVPASWEDEGYPEYDGFAWYRKEFKLDALENTNNTFYIRLGYIDDVDQAFLNGHLIGGMGQFPPEFITAVEYERRYPVPNEFVNFKGKNVLAVRVYDGLGLGGIRSGKLGFNADVPDFDINLNLAGSWKFHHGDRSQWKESDYDDRHWNSIIVPGTWESQGNPNLDGFAWYRKSFVLTNELNNQRLILLLGKIDDMDCTYLNGNLIGRTGNMNDDREYIQLNSVDHITLRAYYIPGQYLNENGENYIAVRVYDGGGTGGIHSGAIGIITRDNYLKKVKNK